MCLFVCTGNILEAERLSETPIDRQTHGAERRFIVRGTRCRMYVCIFLIRVCTYACKCRQKPVIYVAEECVQQMHSDGWKGRV